VDRRVRAQVWIAGVLPLLIAATPVELTVHVAVGADGAPVADDAWIDAELATASARLGGADAGVRFARVPGATDGVPADIATVADRDALRAQDADDGTVHVFVAARVADKDKDGVVGGVTWHKGRHRYILLSRGDARDDTLAHELGHFFGLPHAALAGNLMTPHRAPDGTLTDDQLAIVRRRIAAFTTRR
jgi:hypothetical protein